MPLQSCEVQLRRAPVCDPPARYSAQVHYDQPQINVPTVKRLSLNPLPTAHKSDAQIGCTDCIVLVGSTRAPDELATVILISNPLVSIETEQLLPIQVGLAFVFVAV